MSDEIAVDEQVDGDRGIPSVSSNGEKRSGFSIAMIVLGVVGVLILSMYWPSGEVEGEVEALPAKEDIDFNRERIIKFELPDAPEVIQMPNDNPSNPESIAIDNQVGNGIAPIESEPRLTEAQILALQTAADVRERRKRSPLVSYDAMSNGGGVGESSNSRVNTTASAEQTDLFKQIAAAQGGNRKPAKDFDSVEARLTPSPVTTVKASYLQDRNFIIAQGKMVGAVLETAISSDLPGMVRAIVSESVYSEDGRNLLIEKGSRLIGKYRGGLTRGQARVFVIWNRLITPWGIDVQIASPGAGVLGQSGYEGWIDQHFMERFGASVLLSVIGAASVQSNGGQFSSALGQNFNDSASTVLDQTVNIRPTLHKNQGDRIKVFVARDLNFKSVLDLRSQ